MKIQSSSRDYALAVGFALEARERPILFSAPMVRALLAGTKTQTRRVVKPQPAGAMIYRGHFRENQHGWSADEQGMPSVWACKQGQAGDLLWVRERCWIFGQWHEAGLTPTGRPRWRFKAVGERVLFENPGRDQIAYLGRGPGWSFRNSIHLPRWASRISLRITDVRAERLIDCSEADALAEGVEPPATERDDHDWSICPKCGGTGLHGALGEHLGYCEVDCSDCDTGAKRYRHLWEHINGPGSWAENPWVWAVSFERLDPQVDGSWSREAK